MVHPLFGGIPDRYTAEAFSEAMEPAAFKYVYSLAGTDLTEAEGFPPEPAFLTGLSGVFIAEDQQSVRKVGAHGIIGVEFEPTATQLIEAYQARVTIHQEQARELEAIAPKLGLERVHPEYGRLGQWTIEQTRKQGKRLIAAHLVFVAPGSHRVHDALVYPISIRNTFPWIVREAVKGELLNSFETDEGAGSQPMPEDMRNSIPPIMQNTQDAQAVAAIPPSVVMPSLEEFTNGLRLQGYPGI